MDTAAERKIFLEDSVCVTATIHLQMKRRQTGSNDLLGGKA